MTEVNFVGFRQDYKGQTAQEMREMVSIQQQIAELGEKCKEHKPISLTAPIKNAIINWNKRKVSLELLDTFVREVRVGSDGAVKIEWEFGER